jgi:hypothetical protein
MPDHAAILPAGLICGFPVAGPGPSNSTLDGIPPDVIKSPHGTRYEK